MPNTKHNVLRYLQKLNLSNEEARIYVELVNEPDTHLQLGRKTGINRTKVYRIIEQLEKRSLVFRRTDDRGTFLVAQDISALEIELIAQEESLKQQRASLSRAIAELETLSRDHKRLFTVRTYEGIAGFRQMQWHELKAKDEVLVLGNVTVEELVGSRLWSERFRRLSADHGHKTREIINVPYAKPRFTEQGAFLRLYEGRIVAKDVLPASTPVVIYNDVVAIYQFNDEKRVGTEIVNAAYAQTMRYIFEHYWKLGVPTK